MSGVNQAVPHQILANYFSFLEVFKFSRAIKCFKTRQALEIPAPWSTLFLTLANLATYESTYYKLTYLNSAKPKVKIADLYVQVHADLRFLIDSPNAPAPSQSSSSKILSSGSNRKSMAVVSLSQEDTVFFSSLLQQIGIIIVVRVDMLAVFNTFVSWLSTSTLLDYDQLLAMLDALPVNFRDKVTHPILHRIKINLLHEISILRRLLMAQVAISSSEYKDSILLLAQCRMEFDTWRDEIKRWQTEQKIQQTKQFPKALHQWLSMFLSSLTSKLTLYFFPIFKKTEMEITPGTSLTTKELKLDPDYFAVIESFVQRTNAYNISLIHECKGKPYNKDGYTCVKSDDPPTGLNSWPAVYSYPKEPPREHWPNIVSILLDNYGSLAQSKDPYVHFYDNKINFTYYLSRVEPQITMAVLFADKKKSNEQAIWEFILAMLRALRNRDIFGLLLMMKEARDR